jgi:hypothetical protein
VVDVTPVIKLPFNLQRAAGRVSDVMRQYGVTQCSGDKYAAEFVVDAFKRCETKAPTESPIVPPSTLRCGRRSRVAARLVGSKRLINQCATP